MWAHDQQSIEHTCTWAFKHPSIHTSYRPITLGIKYDHQSMWVPEHPTTWTFQSPSTSIYHHSSVSKYGLKINLMKEWHLIYM